VGQTKFVPGRDLVAVRAAFTLPWSNGQTEGHVNRLKFLKRQMYWPRRALQTNSLDQETRN
jgi:hypothetical protein